MSRQISAAAADPGLPAIIPDFKFPIPDLDAPAVWNLESEIWNQSAPPRDETW